MTRVVIYFGVAFFTFLLGVCAWFANPLGWKNHRSQDPLRVVLSLQRRTANPKSCRARYVVTVENVSTRTIRGYSLGFTCSCRGWDRDNNPYPSGINFTNPNPQDQLLRPGESQELPIPFDSRSGDDVKAKVWVDLVHFEGGGNWGKNQSHKEGYVRE
jgi:hypothetical protein